VADLKSARLQTLAMVQGKAVSEPPPVVLPPAQARRSEK